MKIQIFHEEPVFFSYLKLYFLYFPADSGSTKNGS